MKDLFKGMVFGAIALSMVAGQPIQAATPQWIDATHHFEKDVLALTQSVKRETKAENAKRFKAPLPTPKVYKVGDLEKFWTKNIAEDKFEQTEATVKAIGKHCYVFVEKGKNVPDSAIQKIVRDFDEVVYPTNTSTFGSEWKPGIDGDERITLLLFDIKDGYNGSGGYVGGYFFAGDQFLQSQIPPQYNVKSNEREMFYLDIHPADPTSDKYLGIVAHEFQHMIHFAQDPKEATWVNEACSQIASYLCKYGHPGQIMTFMQTPDNSLTAWAKEQMVANYGQVYLWNYYLANRFMKNETVRQKFFRNLVADKAQSIDGFNNGLKQFSVDMQAVFPEFAIANFINDPALDKGQFAYDSTLARLRLPPTAQIKAFPASVKDQVFVWSADGIKADLTAAKANVKISFKGNLANFSGKANSFVVAAITSDSRNKISPKISYLKLAAAGKDMTGTLDLAKGEFDTLQVIVVAMGPKGVPTQSYVQAPQIPYSIDLTDSGNVVATTRGPRRIRPQRLIEDYVVAAEAALSRDDKVSHVAFTNLESLSADMGTAVMNQLEAGNTEAIDKLLEVGQDTETRSSLRPLAKKVAVQMEIWRIQKGANSPEIQERIDSLKSF
jgi:hypothetical protein